MPDAWVALRAHDGIIELEQEVSNASFVPGQKARAVVDAAVSIEPPAGYEIVEDCSRPWPTRWYPMHAAFRRFVMYPTGRPGLHDDAKRIAAGVMDTKTAQLGHENYGPCNMPMPKLSPQQDTAGRQRVANWLSHLRSMLTMNQIGTVEDSEDGLLVANLFGWRPWGIPARDAPAGSGIFFWTGWEWCQDHAAYLWLAAACNHERQWHAYHRKTGEPITADDYGDPGPMYQQATRDPNNGWLPEFRGVAATLDPIIDPYNAGHSIRGFRHLIALSEMSDSPMVKRALAGQAAQWRLQCSERGPHPSGGYTPPSLRTYRDWMKAAPHNGFYGSDTGRQNGWPAFLIAQSIKKGAAKNMPWAKMFVEFVELGAMPNGILSRCAAQPGSVWHDPDHDTAHAFEVPILYAGATGCARQAGVPVPPSMLRAFQALYEESPKAPYYSGEVGPYNYSYVAERGGAPYQTVIGGKAWNNPQGDATHTQTGSALAISQSSDPRYLVSSAGVGAATPDWKAKKKMLEGKADLKNDAGLLAQYQRVAP